MSEQVNEQASEQELRQNLIKAYQIIQKLEKENAEMKEKLEHHRRLYLIEREDEEFNI